MEARSLAIDLVEGATVSVPLVDFKREAFNASGRMWVLELRLELLAYGYGGVTWRGASATFTPRWANPLWALSDLAASSEALQVQRKTLQHITTAWSSLPQFPAWLDSEKLLPVIGENRLLRFYRAVWLVMQSLGAGSLHYIFGI